MQKSALIKNLILVITSFALLVAASFAWFYLGAKSGTVGQISADIWQSDGPGFAYSIKIWDGSAWQNAPMTEENTLDTSMLIPGGSFRYKVIITADGAGYLTMKLDNMTCNNSYILDVNDEPLYPTLAPALHLEAYDAGTPAYMTAQSKAVDATLADLMDEGMSDSATVFKNLHVSAAGSYEFEYTVELFENPSEYDGTQNESNSALMGEFVKARFNLYFSTNPSL